MRIAMISIAVFTGFGGLLAQDVKPASATIPSSIKAFHGLWKPDSITYDGAEQVDATSRDKIRLSVENGLYKMYFVVDASKGLGQRLASSALSADPTKKTFELVFQDGPRKGEKVHGIYEVTATTLKLCYAPATKPLPTSFEAPKGSANFLETWTREK